MRGGVSRKTAVKRGVEKVARKWLEIDRANAADFILLVNPGLDSLAKKIREGEHETWACSRKPEPK